MLPEPVTTHDTPTAESHQRDDVGAPSSRATFSKIAASIVWIVWAAMFALFIVFVARFRRDVPYQDDWHLLAPATGNPSISLQWLWHSPTGHRIAVPKLILVSLLKMSGLDFRVGMYADAIVMALVAAVMIIVARRLRGGRTILADAIFPLLLMHWG